MTESITCRPEQTGRPGSILGGNRFVMPTLETVQTELRQRVDDAWKRNRTWAASLRGRYWALEAVAIATELCGIDLSNEKKSTDHILNEDFVDLMKQTKGVDPYDIQRAAERAEAYMDPEKDQPEPPVLEATRLLLDASPEASAELKEEAINFAKLLIGLRSSRETGQGAKFASLLSPR